MVGTSFPYLEFLPRPGQARAVQIELDPARIGLRYPVEVGLVGDSRRTLEALLPRLSAKGDRSFLERAQAGMKDWWALMESRGTRADTPMKPQVVAWELGRRLRDRGHRRVRQRHDHDLVGAQHPGEARPDALGLGQPRQHGARGALRHRRTGGLSRAASAWPSWATAGSPC